MTNQLVTITEIKEMAKISYASRLFQMPNVESMATLMMLCQAEGVHPLQALKRYHIIQGRPAMRADAMLAEFQKAGGKIQWNERTDKKCSATFEHEQGGKLTVEWTIAMAKEACLLNNPTWKKYPRQMLTARVISEGIRTIYPAIATGIYTPEEIGDITVKAEKVTDKPKKQNKPAPAIETVEPIKVADSEKKTQLAEPEPAKITKPSTRETPETRTGVQIANQMKQARELLVLIGCKNRGEMATKTSELIGRELGKSEGLMSLSFDEMKTLLTKLEDHKLAVEVDR